MFPYDNTEGGFKLLYVFTDRRDSYGIGLQFKLDSRFDLDKAKGFATNHANVHMLQPFEIFLALYYILDWILYCSHDL